MPSVTPGSWTCRPQTHRGGVHCRWPVTQVVGGISPSASPLDMHCCWWVSWQQCIILSYSFFSSPHFLHLTPTAGSLRVKEHSTAGSLRVKEHSTADSLPVKEQSTAGSLPEKERWTSIESVWLFPASDRDCVTVLSFGDSGSYAKIFSRSLSCASLTIHSFYYWFWDTSGDLIMHGSWVKVWQIAGRELIYVISIIYDTDTSIQIPDIFNQNSELRQAFWESFDVLAQYHTEWLSWGIRSVGCLHIWPLFLGTIMS